MNRAVLLDLYDTLVCADWRALAAEMAACLRVDEQRLFAAFAKTRGGRGVGRYGSVQGDVAATIDALALPHDAAMLVEVEARLVQFLADSMHVYEDVPPALQALRAAGYRTAIVSNCDHATRAALSKCGIALDVDAVVLSCEAGCEKPHASIYELACARVEVAPARAVFVDDQPRFLDGARALGMRTFRIERAVSYSEAPETSEHPVITSLDELVRKLCR